jgi:hypothetical protein
MRRCASGQAMLEFVLVFPVFLLLVLGIIQFAELSNAHQVVNYASYMAARAAIVKGNHKLAAAICCIAISPNALSSKGIPGIKELGNLADPIIENVTGMEHFFDKLPFAYALSHCTVSYFKKNGDSVKINKEDVLEKKGVDHLEVKLTYYYPLIIPLVNVFMANYFAAKRSKDGDIFNADNKEASKESEALIKVLNLFSHWHFIPIEKRCTMGID